MPSPTPNLTPLETKTMDYTKFRIALKDESIWPVTDNIFNFIISHGEKIKYKKNDVIIDYNSVEPDIYCILEGIVRGDIINEGGVERTIGFGLCGTIIYSSQCYTLLKPSIIQYTACCPCTILRIKKTTFDAFLSENHEFCKWFLGSLLLTVCFRDLRNEGMNGDALYKYKWLRENRPEILQVVPDKVIASYLNITEVHLSRIKNKILKDIPE